MRSANRFNKKHRIYVRDNGHCHYCARLCDPFGLSGTDKQNEASATLDHVQTRAAGGNNHDQNLVLACHRCNNLRSCIPYGIFLTRRLWLDENADLRREISRLFAIGVSAVREETKNVWLLEMYMEEPDEPIHHQNWGVFANQQGDQKFMASKFPDAVQNDDDLLGYMGFHHPEGHVLDGVSFVANAWDLQ